jgi:glycosyltransferase involved in cell wall biosynthesis
MKSSLIILTLNEIEGIRVMYDRIPFETVDEFFVVDGGSIDGTVEFFREKGIRVVPQEIKGRGEAFRIAVKEAKGDHLIFFSPDGNEDPGDIPKLVELLRKEYDIAIASRFLPDSRNEEDDLLFPWRAWANRTFTYIANIIWNTNRNYITDTINGYRAVKKETFNKLNIDAQGFVIEYQMSIRAMKLGLKIVEIPTIEGQRIGGASTANSIPTGFIFMKHLLREIRIRRNF